MQVFTWTLCSYHHYSFGGRHITQCMSAIMLFFQSEVLLRLVWAMEATTCDGLTQYGERCQLTPSDKTRCHLHTEDKLREKIHRLEEQILRWNTKVADLQKKINNIRSNLPSAKESPILQGFSANNSKHNSEPVTTKKKENKKKKKKGAKTNTASSSGEE